MNGIVPAAAVSGAKLREVLRSFASLEHVPDPPRYLAGRPGRIAATRVSGHRLALPPRAPPAKWTRNFGYGMPTAYGTPPICYLKLKVLKARQPGMHSGRRKH